jgi:hypothetical protein
VAIGSADNPVAGAILDLNSGAAGGLLLSNVAIEDPEKIPDDFPGITSENATAAKAGLSGAMVYNTNTSATCPGVHVWDGRRWERIVSGLPRKSAGEPLTITSDVTTLFGGGTVDLEVATVAKTYTWYDTDTIEHYLATTTTPFFSGPFPDGKHTVRVVSDNCRFLEESNGVTFEAGKVSPSFGSVDGNNTIYIYGEFSYAATGDYEQSGLVAHYDGINNRGLGDKQHDYNAAAWKDLKTGFDLPRIAASDGKWLSNGFQSLNTTVASANDLISNLHNYALFYSAAFPGTYPVGNSERTIEVIFRTPAPGNMFTQVEQLQRWIFAYGKATEGNLFSVIYRGSQIPECLDIAPYDNPWIFYPIGGNNHNLFSCLCSTPSLETPNTINTVTSTYQNSINDEHTNSFINNTQAYIVSRMGGTLDTGTDFISIGVNLPYATFLSARLYSRVLTAQEIEHNAQLDQIRYLNPPKVTVGDEECSEVVVLSRNILMCKVPASTTGTGKKDVVINGVRYNNAYEYVAANAFHISGISPIVGPVAGGIELTLTGNKLNEIAEIRVDEDSYTGADLAKSNGTCSIMLRSHSAGEVDILVTTTGNQTYRLAKVFEYK